MLRDGPVETHFGSRRPAVSLEQLARTPHAIGIWTLKTGDNIELDGAWYPSRDGRPCPAASILAVHGLGWNFYRGPSRWLPPLLVAAGYSCLALNMRDHDINEVRDFDISYYDVAAGIAFLERLQLEANRDPSSIRPGEHGSFVAGYIAQRDRALDQSIPGDVVLLGHGHGCNKVLCYTTLSGDRRPFRRVLMTLGAIKSYKPEVWESSLASAAEIRGNILVIQGAEDPLIAASDRAVELSEAARGAKVEVILLEGGDHYFNGQHDASARCILDWLRRTEVEP